MLIKICGLKYADNIQELVRHSIDMMGFIFYPKSSRFVAENLDVSVLKNIPKNIKKVGVFVQPSLEEIKQKMEAYQLDIIQLHGDESPDFCEQIKNLNMCVMKAFQVDEKFNFSGLNSYQKHCDYFLFDTKTTAYGGSGKAFDWSLLNRYLLTTPFFLSGGIGLENSDEALSFHHPQLVGFDINSKIEIKPGLKSIDSATTFIQKIRNHESIKTK